jgi:sulfate permease, SulP family
MSLVAAWSRRIPARVRDSLARIDLLPIRHVVRTYDRRSARADLRAGFTGALVAFPQGVACAMIAGVPLAYGLFGSAVASILGPLFTRSRMVVLGPTNATAVLLLSAFLVAGVESDAERATMMALVGVLAGAMQVLAGYLNIGSLVAYISRSVIVGYIASAVLMIVAHQVENLLGVHVEESSTFVGVVQSTVVHLSEAHLPTVAVAALTVLVLVTLRRLAPRLPHVAITLVASIGLGFGAAKIGQPVELLPAISVTSWAVTTPRMDFETINQLASAALALAFLGVLESNSIGKLLAARAGERFHSNQETYALGMANIGNALLGGLPASGSPTRSMLNYSCGAATPFSSAVCGILTLILIFGLGDFVGVIPRASLAVIVVWVAVGLFNLRQIRFVVRSTRTDAIVFFITAGAALVFPLDAAIFFGTATSIVLFLRQAGEPELIEYAFNAADQLTAVPVGEKRPLPEISIVHVEGSLFFGAAELLQEQIRRACADPNLRILILRLKHAHHLDASTVLALEELVQFMRENGRGLIVSGARKEVTRVCRRTGLIDLIGRENFFVEWPTNPTLSTRNALRRAQQLLGRKDADVSVFGETKMVPVGGSKQ